MLAPGTVEEARAAYREVSPAAREVVRETARAMGFDAEEYRERVSGDVVGTAREALFASLLTVRVGTIEEFDDWRAGYDGDCTVIGSEQVDRAVWHAVPFADTAVAATFQEEEDAAVSTLRRQAFGRHYRDRL